MNKEDIKTLDNWFIKNEGCTYKEFCDIYNNGKELISNLPFIEFPKKILKILQSGLEYPKELVDFLQKEGIYDSFLINREKGRNIDRYFVVIQNNFIEAINYAFDWFNTKEGSGFWMNVNNKWKERFR